jgi:hypothetical protein
MFASYATEWVAIGNALPMVYNAHLWQIDCTPTGFARTNTVIGIFGTIEDILVKKSYLLYYSMTYQLAGTDDICWLKGQAGCYLLGIFVASFVLAQVRVQYVAHFDSERWVGFVALLRFALRIDKSASAYATLWMGLHILQHLGEGFSVGDSIVVEEPHILASCSFNASVACISHTSIMGQALVYGLWIVLCDIAVGTIGRAVVDNDYFAIGNGGKSIL